MRYNKNFKRNIIAQIQEHRKAVGKKDSQHLKKMDQPSRRTAKKSKTALKSDIIKISRESSFHNCKNAEKLGQKAFATFKEIRPAI